MVTLLSGFLLLKDKEPDFDVSFAGSPPGLYNNVASSSTMTVGPQQELNIFTKTENCTSRVIGTNASSILMGIGSTTITNGISGLTQAGSTTVVYDAEVYGCEQVRGYASGSTTITRIEYR